VPRVVLRRPLATGASRDLIVMHSEASVPGAVHGLRHAGRGGWFTRFRRRFFHVDPTDLEPVVLRHRRIYILPTRRGAAFIATILIMLLMSLNDALSLGFMVTFLLAGLVAASLLHAFRNLAGLEIRPLSAGETFAGSELPFTLVLAGAGTPRTAVMLATRDGVAVGADVVPGDGAVTVTVGLPAPRRGRYPLGRITLSSDYPLGLWHAWAYVHFPLAGIAFPSPERDAPPLPAGATSDDAGATARGDTADLAGLRGYQTGDPMQRIAWKAVARGAGWHTKLFEGASGSGTLDLSWHALPAALDTETRLARLAAWVLAAERVARPFALSVPGAALPPGQGRDHRRAALTALALCPATAP
jgi:uncharacterized protein (DUF58 family)